MKTKEQRLSGWWWLITLLFLASQSAASSERATCHMEWAPMRDGVRLATEVYLPQQQGEESIGKLPVVLTRSLYNNVPGRHPPSRCDSANMEILAARGYAVLNQDVRGTARSEGTLNPIHQETSDGYDAVEWAALQPWSNGKIGLGRR